MTERYEKLRRDAEEIISYALEQVKPDEAVRRAVEGHVFPSGKIILVSVGKAAWRMAHAVCQHIRPDAGIVITKYGHTEKEIEGIHCYEAGHPIPDQNGIIASEEVLRLTSGLKEEDTVLFLLSGGASALFEVPLIPLAELQAVNEALLKSGADIREINTVRKRLSKVKGGRFAEHCSPATVFSVVLSDIIGDPLDMIGSGPAYPDTSSSEDALRIIEKYHIPLSVEAKELLHKETPKSLDNIEVRITGSVRELCNAAAHKASERDYQTEILSAEVSGIASEEGEKLALHARERMKEISAPLALIEGGETVVHVKGSGLGGRNQELALSAAETISGHPILIFSVGSDGTDGPTDAAGAYTDGSSYQRFLERGIDPKAVLDDNDSYHALKEAGNLIITGPTGTNVNDLTVALILPEEEI